uniref:Uncharacterized protein n=1 Tax=Rhizophora mucronata TaxID=61149 RepID=A0A2P2NT69_RHIMU
MTLELRIPMDVCKFWKILQKNHLFKIFYFL